MDVALDGAHEEGADAVGVGVGQQRAQDVQRALHRARGDEHLGDEVVAALEARAHLLERRDQRVEEHALGLHALLEPRLDVGLHLGRLADERVVVERLQDLLVRHAALSPGRCLPRRSLEGGRLPDEDRCQLGHARAGQAQRGARDAQRGDDLAGRPADGRGERASGRPRARRRRWRSRRGARARARRSSAARSTTVSVVSRASGPGGARPRRRRGRPCRWRCSGSRRGARPTGRRRGSGGRRPGRGGRRRRGWGPTRLTVSPLAWATRLERGLGQLDQVALQAAAMGEAQDRRARARACRARRPGGRGRGARARVMSREAVLLGRSAASARSRRRHRLVALEQAREHLAGRSIDWVP